jgi:hypothetical protein
MLTKLIRFLRAVAVFLFTGGFAAPAAEAPFRPPAVPLVVSDPYLSIWSEADHLTDDVTRHWTHHPHSLISLVRVDGAASRLMGREPADLPTLPQTGLEVTPTRTIYEFEDPKIHVTLTFMTPALPDDLDVLSRPVTYITWSARSVDGAPHQVSIFMSASSELCVNTTDEKVVWTREKPGGLTSSLARNLTWLRVGTEKQPILGSSGDDHRIDWGYAYAAAHLKADKATAVLTGNDTALRCFVRDDEMPGEDDTRMPRPVTDDQPVMAFAFHLGEVAARPATCQVLVAYDEIDSIRYFGRNLQPYWRRDGATPSTLLRQAEKDYDKLAKRCENFDRQLMEDMTRAGGVRYARMAALAYRQCLAACGLAADENKQPLFFTKENTSNGDIATVDVIFPMDPVWIFLSPTLAKCSLVPILSYAASWHWKFPNAPHDLGTYPNAPGRDDGGEGMPVEESGNMLILCDAICQEEDSAGFVAPWWPQLTQWAQYLEKFGLDPEDQLCTDDFMGHLAHNSNLSIKAILGLAAYGDLCRLHGDTAGATKYAGLAKADAAHWITAAGDGDHSRLAFDKPGTWSQKYNLVWDRILGLNVFPPEVARTEVAYYKTVMQRFGVPLDSRTKLTKTDWSVWSATLAENPADFAALTSPIYDYLNQTTQREPLADSYVTDDANSTGMHARPVVGGIFIKMLTDPAVWKKWSRRDHAKVGNWAPLPPPAPAPGPAK